MFTWDSKKAIANLKKLKNEKETVRIISARQASRKERQAYAG